MQVQGDVDVNINACRGEVWAFLTDPHAVGRCAPGRRLNKTRPMVLLTDISGSMEARTQLLLMAAYGLARGYGAPFEAFVFGTPLTRIARPLMTLPVDRVLDRVARQGRDWSGGTRIGDALHAFNHQWTRRVDSGGAAVCG